MAQFNRSSPYRRAQVFIDDGLLREGRRTEFLGPYPPLRFLQRPDNIHHVLRRRDTLDHLATFFFNDPKLWWVIADYQPESDIPILAPLEPLEIGRVVIIPSFRVVRAVFATE